MRLLLELFALFFALTVIYRRLIQPFIQGIKGMRNPDNQAPRPKQQNFRPSSSKKNVEAVDPKKIQDAEFEEIK